MCEHGKEEERVSEQSSIPVGKEGNVNTNVTTELERPAEPSPDTWLWERTQLLSWKPAPWD